MRQPTRPIWESASRPLFVRSVWLETTNEGRSHRRHFILDYQPRERERWKRKGNTGSPQRRQRVACQPSQSYELYEETDFYSDSVDELDEYLLLDATKLTLQQQQQQQQSLIHGSANSTKAPTSSCSQKASRYAKRRAWLLSRGKSYNSGYNRHELTDPYSRRSSLQDIQSTLSSHNSINPEERLAERVLNWLDLAGRTDILRTATPSAVSHTQLARSSQRSRQQQRSRLESGDSMRRSAAQKRQPTAPLRGSAKKPAKLMPQPAAPASAANAKPITIIFNKEGVPVRLNRPARNIDLCALSSSASTTRRLAGQLASARLYSGAASPRAQPQLTELSTPPHSGRGQASSASPDSKKQLHIFMPSLPKKGLLTNNSSDDGQYSGLSTSFSELCQI